MGRRIPEVQYKPKPIPTVKTSVWMPVLSIPVDKVAVESVDTLKKERAVSPVANAVYFSHANQQFVTTQTHNPLVAAAHLSYAMHLPFEISPDILWNTILQGLSAHINANSELYRYNIVNHAGKKQIVVRDDSLAFENNWTNAIGLIKRQILDQVDVKFKSALDTEFSTTGPIEATAHIASMMDALKSFFEYRVMSCCGIPRVDIAGTREDYIRIGTTIEPILKTLDFEIWNLKLQAIIQGIVNTFDNPNNTITAAFWSSMYKYNGPQGSGDEAHITGWLAHLFPYLKSNVKNPLVFDLAPIDKKFKRYQNNYVPLAEISSGITLTPFVWSLIGVEKPMVLAAGLVGVGLTTKGAVRAELGYAIGPKEQ